MLRLSRRYYILSGIPLLNAYYTYHKRLEGSPKVNAFHDFLKKEVVKVWQRPDPDKA
jgi:hypothetical protein